ncbi:hypothetical protein FRB94_009793 [Tulasnella sp. JGI-2019a]|nr:hypothetical protein FRB93_009024 [Tulasnella sp. JGI-2019a]KAG8994572.1 hypothetical protein FRB94_009793 [Tulasnella sp. JGI-2019a]
MLSPIVRKNWQKLVAAILGCVVLSALLEYHTVVSLERPSWLRLENDPPPFSEGGERPSVLDMALDGSWKEVNRTEFNRPYHERLQSCKSSASPCTENSGKLVILALDHFKAVLKGSTQGEDLWCDSFMDSLHALGYSMLIPNNRMELYSMWREYHEHVQLIVWNQGEAMDCLFNISCVQANPDAPLFAPNATHLNIPLWKIFSMHFWNNPKHPLGSPFTLSPEDYSMWTPRSDGHDNYYLGYSLERTCTKVPFVPHNSRPRQAYVFAKGLKLFVTDKYILEHKDDNDSIERIKKDEFYKNLSAEANITFVGKMKHDAPGILEAPPPGITILDSITNRTTFQTALARSRVVMGIGNPPLSPTPWEALCMGVPFINPIRSWDHKHPEDRSRWVAQQDAILYLGLDEPYVYHVKIGDRIGLEAAIRKAMDTPIDRYILPHMRMSALIERTRRLVETDWRPEARKQLPTIAHGPS